MGSSCVCPVHLSTVVNGSFQTSDLGFVGISRTQNLPSNSTSYTAATRSLNSKPKGSLISAWQGGSSMVYAELRLRAVARRGMRMPR